MNFSEALTAMRMGSKLSREIWRGKVSYWRLVPGLTVQTDTRIISDKAAHDSIVATYPNGMKEQVLSIVAQDILAEDWWVVT